MDQRELTHTPQTKRNVISVYYHLQCIVESGGRYFQDTEEIHQNPWILAIRGGWRKIVLRGVLDFSNKHGEWSNQFQNYIRYIRLWTDDSQTLWSPHGSRPHGHDRSVVMCVNDPVLQTTECPDEDLSLLVPETYSDTPSVKRQLSTSGVLQMPVGFE